MLSTRITLPLFSFFTISLLLLFYFDSLTSPFLSFLSHVSSHCSKSSDDFSFVPVSCLKAIPLF